MIFDMAEVEERIGYSFKNKELLRQCFTHSSYANENRCKDNELLEFFGDSVIQFTVTEYLFKNCAGDEGKLTLKRQSIVSEKPLKKAVDKMGVGEFMLLGKGLVGNTVGNEKLYSSLFEAITAGIYLDGGIVKARKFIKDKLLKYAEEEKADKKDASAKTYLQEYVQKYKLGSISYETLGKKGPDHLPEFRAAALLNGRRISEGTGGSKQAAQADAADKALIKLKQGGK